jgi:hypothetical protein
MNAYSFKYIALNKRCKVAGAGGGNIGETLYRVARGSGS